MRFLETVSNPNSLIRNVEILQNHLQEEKTVQMAQEAHSLLLASYGSFRGLVTGSRTDLFHRVTVSLLKQFYGASIVDVDGLLPATSQAVFPLVGVSDVRTYLAVSLLSSPDLSRIKQSLDGDKSLCVESVATAFSLTYSTRWPLLVDSNVRVPFYAKVDGANHTVIFFCSLSPSE